MIAKKRKLFVSFLSFLFLSFHLISLWKDGNGGSTGVDSATSFSCWYPLHSVDATLILEAAIHALPTDSCTH